LAWLVKGFIIRNGRVVNIDISIGLIDYCKTHTRFQCHFNEPIRIQQEQNTKRK